MIRKLLSVPESVAHYSIGSVLLVAQLVRIAAAQRQPTRAR